MKILILILCGIVLLAISGCCSTESKMSMENNAVLLDVRTPAEYQKGYLPGAINLPQADVDTKVATVVPSKDTPVYVYCRGGREATMATEKLLKQGYTDVHNLGAMKNARKKLNLPIKK